nr:NADH dehydrogenase subunit 6 [Yoda sp. d ASH-2021]
MAELLSVFIIGGGVLVFISRSPYFSALGVVSVVIGFSGILIMGGSVFLGLVFLLIYLGGMLIVFSYSAALSSDYYPYGGGWSAGVLVFLSGGIFLGFVFEGGDLCGNFGVVEDLGLIGVSSLYDFFWVGLLGGGFGLLVCLLAVLYLVRGLASGSLKPV